MKKGRILSVIMTLLMVISMIPSMVFAEAIPALEGKLQVKGLAAVGITLSANYTNVTPAGVTDDSVTFSWNRQNSEDPADLTELSTEKTYKVTEQDLGFVLVLKIAGKEDMGFSGSLTASTKPVAATEAEAQAILDAESQGETPEEGDLTAGDGTGMDDGMTAGDGTGMDDGMTAGDGTGMDDGMIVGDEPLAEEPMPEVSYSMEAQTDDGSGVVDFGTIYAGEMPEARYVTIFNTGTGDLTFGVTSPANFWVNDLTVLAANMFETVAVQPRDTTVAGYYEETITYTSNEGVSVSFVAKVNVENAPSEENEGSNLEDEPSGEGMPEEPSEGEQPSGEDFLSAPSDEQTYTFEASAATADGSGILDFGTVYVGTAGDAEKQYVTITNIGTGTLNFNGLTPEHFAVHDITEALEPGQSTDVWVQPRAELGAGVYEDIITYTTQEGAEASFTARVTVETEELEPTDDLTDEELEPADDMNVGGENPLDDDILVDPDEKPDEENPVPFGLMVDMATPEITFENLTEGYDTSSLQAAVVRVANTGENKGTITLVNAADLQYVDVIMQDASQTGEEGAYEFWFLPKSGLKASEVPYTEWLVFGILEAPEAPTETVTANVSVNPAPTTPPEPTATPTPEPTATPVPTATPTPEPTATPVPTATPTPEPTATPAPTATPTPEPVYSFDAAPGALEFGSAEKGAAVPDAKTVTITNTGNQPLNLKQPYAETENYVISGLSAVTIEPKATATFTVQPKSGLEVGEYKEQLVIPADPQISAKLTLSFRVTDSAVRLTAVQRGADIANITNGVQKTADSLGLPSTVVIETTAGNMNASVAWNMEACAYDPASMDAQTFEVQGTVTLPDGVVNEDNLALTTAVKVSVNAYAPKIPDDSATTITGISSDGEYTTETKITFTAIGGGMDNQSPRKGDVRYVPASWKVLESRNWDEAPYSATFRMNKGGDYTLTVAYNEQKFDGAAWTKTGNQATRQVNFRVKQVGAVTITPTPTDAQKKAVKTGDTTMIMPFVIILIVAAACIVGVLIYRKKK